MSEYDYVFVCPVCGFMRGGIHQRIQDCNYCGKSLMQETEIPYSAFPQKNVYGHMSLKIGEPEFIEFQRSVFETVIEPMGRLDRNLIEFKMNYAKYYNLPLPEEVQRHEDESWARARSATRLKQLEQQQANRPRCIACGSTNLKKLDVIDRGISVALLGPFSKRFNKSFQCKDCGMTF